MDAVTPDQDVALAAYLETWADNLADPFYQLVFSYTDTGATIDLCVEGYATGPIVRWLFETSR